MMTMVMFYVVLLLAVTTQAQFVPDCTPPTTRFIRNPANCAEFWMCDHGKAVPFKCPTETVFNNIFNVCVWEKEIIPMWNNCNQQVNNQVTPPVSVITPVPVTPPGGLSIAAQCANGATLIPHETECQLFYNCSLVYESIPALFEQHLDECKYPFLFDATVSACRYFKAVTCGARKEFTNRCDYRKNQCSGPGCQGCDRSVNCDGKPDGPSVGATGAWSPNYILCIGQRIHEYNKCPRDDKLDLPTLYSPITRSCVNLYKVPKQYGGITPVCFNKQDGFYEDTERFTSCNMAIRCENGEATNMIRCQQGLVFNPKTQSCQKSSEFCGRCGVQNC